jgi:hypothetical protein
VRLLVEREMEKRVSFFFAALFAAGSGEWIPYPLWFR